MNLLLKLKPMWLSAILACALFSQAHAAFITNGGFESGFTGWTRMNQVGSEGTFALQTGTVSPVNGDPVPAPPQGATAAMTDAQGPGSHVLFQNFTVTTPVALAMLTFDVFVGNRGPGFFSPATLDFATSTLNQQARVDILAGGANAFSVAAADVLQNAFQTNPGDPLISGYNHRSVNITALLNSHLNTPLMLRFAEVDNVFTFQFGVDNVDIQVGQAVPEPSTWMMTCGAVLGLFRLRRRFR
jgi:hypothetical protein